MIKLKEIELQNSQALKDNYYKNKTVEQIENIVLQWKNKTLDGKYFEMLGVFNEKELVGVVSIYEQTKNSVSLGIEIFEQFRKIGYGYLALNCALKRAKKKGYKLTVNQVRTDNKASIQLCKKCQLETNFYEYINKKGNAIYLYVKKL